MAIEILHSRVATLVDNSNPDEIQADDWNDAHPITADGMGILFADSAGDVAETMTVDMGTLTASTPLTFKQTWDNVAQDVAFTGVRVEINDGLSTNGDVGSSYFSVVQTDGVTPSTTFRVSDNGINARGSLRLYTDDVDTATAKVVMNQTGVTFGEDGVDTSVVSVTTSGLNVRDWADPLIDPENAAVYSATGISRAFSTGPFFMPITETELSQWANVPTNTDIADGYSQVGVDTNTGDIYLAANVGGTIFKVQLT